MTIPVPSAESSSAPNNQSPWTPRLEACLLMCNNSRVYNVTRRFWMKFGQVERSITKSCSFVWVIKGETFRDATPQEAVAMRNEQAKQREALPLAEIPGLIFRPNEANQASHRREAIIARAADRFELGTHPEGCQCRKHKTAA